MGDWPTPTTAPTALSIPGHHQRPQRAARQRQIIHGRENLLVLAAKTLYLDGVLSPNSTLDMKDCERWVSKSRYDLQHCYSYFWFVRDNGQQLVICHTGIMCCGLLHYTTGSWSNSLFAKKYEYSFKQTNYVGARGTFSDCSNESPLLVAYLFSGFIYCRYKALLNSYMTLWIYLVLQQWNSWTIGQNWRRSQVIGITLTFLRGGCII